MRALKVFYSDVGEGGVAVNCEKTQFFRNTLYILHNVASFQTAADMVSTSLVDVGHVGQADAGHAGLLLRKQV